MLLLLYLVFKVAHAQLGTELDMIELKKQLLSSNETKKGSIKKKIHVLHLSYSFRNDHGFSSI